MELSREKCSWTNTIKVSGYVCLAVLFLLLTLQSLRASAFKVIFISWISLASLLSPVVFYDKITDDPKRLVWAYGISSGSMVLSAVIFMLPQVSGMFGKVGLGVGIVIGYGVHTIGHNSSHRLEQSILRNSEFLSLTLHTIFAGAALGFIYSQTPSISIILGLSIVSHKLPAGFSTLNKLDDVQLIIVPSVIFGIFCLGSFLYLPLIPSGISSFLFGVGAGVFIHLAMDFLPECERGDIYEVVSQSDQEHTLLDSLRYHAFVSVFVGGTIVVFLWLFIAG